MKKADNKPPQSVDEYISQFPPEVQKILNTIRYTIKKAVPNAAERISYGMPFYEYGGTGYKGRLIYFAAFKKHISVFIPPREGQPVPADLKKYHVSKATYQFPLDKPFPYKLLEQTVKMLVKASDTKIENSNFVKNNKNTGKSISKDILSYNSKQTAKDKSICGLLAKEITRNLSGSENKLWHGHPVWFLDGNPIVGYSKQKNGIRLMFWSGADFEEEKLNVRGGKFKDASIFFNNVTEINTKDLKRWLKKSKEIQWDYKNIVKRKGKLIRIENKTR